LTIKLKPLADTSGMSISIVLVTHKDFLCTHCSPSSDRTLYRYWMTLSILYFWSFIWEKLSKHYLNSACFPKAIFVTNFHKGIKCESIGKFFLIGSRYRGKLRILSLSIFLNNFYLICDLEHESEEMWTAVSEKQIAEVQ